MIESDLSQDAMDDERDEANQDARAGAAHDEQHFKCGFDGWEGDEITCPRCLSESPFHEEANQDSAAAHGWPGDGSGEDDLADYNQNEADDYRNE